MREVLQRHSRTAVAYEQRRNVEVIVVQHDVCVALCPPHLVDHGLCERCIHRQITVPPRVYDLLLQLRTPVQQMPQRVL